MSEARRKTVSTDREECAGCDRCTPDRPEGALHLMDGKARLVSDLFCDGLGACVGECPEEREAEPHDERKVVERIAEQGRETIRAAARRPKRNNRTPPRRGQLRAGLPNWRKAPFSWPLSRPEPPVSRTRTWLQLQIARLSQRGTSTGASRQAGPCRFDLSRLVQEAIGRAGVPISVGDMTVTVEGDVVRTGAVAAWTQAETGRMDDGREGEGEPDGLRVLERGPHEALRRGRRPDQGLG